MDRMFSRFRSMSGTKLNKPQPTSSPPSTAATPSKEDILSTLEGFGDKIQEPVPPEDNNNVQHQRRDSLQGEPSVPGDVPPDTTTGSDTEPTITSITHSYSLEWEKLFTKPGYLRHLRNYAIKGHLRSSRFRSISWKLFLNVLPEDSTLWINKTKKMRQTYSDLKDTLIVNPRKTMEFQDLTFNNPLSQEDESPWNRFFLDNELRLTIKQDVIRTFPEIQFFHSEDVRAMMENVLFCYAREHPKLSYRQGMHELLAPMIFVLHCDHQAFLHASEMESLDERIKVVLDPKSLEHDAYAMFSQVMQTVEPWYVSKEVYPTKLIVEPGSTQPFARPQDLNPSNVIVTKLTRIQDYLLKKADHELHLHLERHEIAPQIYGIRWIRLLFGREFPMQDLLVLWDAIFADGIGFDLVDYVFVAMLLYLRDHLLSSDYPSCLIILMKYPPVGDIQFFIDKARHLRDPHQYPRPPTYTYQSAQTTERVKNQQTQHRVSPPPGTVPQHKRASSASLSQVEDTMFRSAPSTSSLARYETQSLRSAVSTPDDGSMGGDSPTRPASVARGRQRAHSRRTPRQAEPNGLETEVASVRGQLHDKEAMCRYCASKLDHHIEELQTDLLRQSLKNEDEIMLSLAGIKQVRDVLKGTLRWSLSLVNENEDIHISDNHYKMDASDSSSPCTDDSPDGHMPPVGKSHGSHTGAVTTRGAAEKRLFYVSSEENSEAVDSPGEPNSSNVINNINFKLPMNLEVELEEFKSSLSAKKSSKMAGYTKSPSHRRQSGPNDCESEFYNSWSPDTCSSKTSEMSADSEEMEDSPNPLYRIRHASFVT